MNIREKLDEFTNGLEAFDSFRSSEMGLDQTVMEYVAALKGFLDGYKVMGTDEWIRTLFDYAASKSYPHKRTSRIEPEHIELYEAVLTGLRELNGSSHFDYPIADGSQEFDTFKSEYESRFIFEMMQLDMAATGHNTIEHVLGVKDVAMHVALQLKSLGLPIDLGVVLGSSLGHDIGKYGVTQHEQPRVPYLHYFYTEQSLEALELDRIGHIATN